MGLWSRLVESISSKLAFFPPTPSYDVSEHADRTGELYIRPLSLVHKVLGCTVEQIKTPRRKGGGGDTVIVFARIPYRPPGGVHKGKILTVLYSHGNAVDLGQMMPFYKELSVRLGCHIVGYDYSGYGCSTGSPSARNTLADVEACLQHLEDVYNTPPEEVIAYGQSVGSGPTVYLGAKVPNLAGLILHAPLMSGMRVLNPNLKWWPSWADVYPNYLLMSKVKCPTLIMHGREDEVIDISHGKVLHKLSKNAVDPLWPEHYNHQNLESCPEYFPTLKKFIAHVQQQSNGNST